MDLSSIWSMILSVISESGVWAMLFLALLIVLIKSNSAREAKYQEIISKLGSSLKKVEEIKEDVEDLKFVSGIGGNSTLIKTDETTSAQKTSTNSTIDKQATITNSETKKADKNDA